MSKQAGQGLRFFDTPLPRMIIAGLGVLVAFDGSFLMAQPPAAESKWEGKILFDDNFESGRSLWETTDDDAWDLIANEGNHSFALNKRISNYQPKVRSPHNIALIKDVLASDFEITFRVRSILDTGSHRDCCVFFGYQDPEHFYYVHLGAKPDPASGQIMIVNNAPRRPLTENKALIPWDDQWHKVRLVRRSSTGEISVFFDDFDRPIMHAIDTTFGAGRIGIGSFDDQNEFDDVRIVNLETISRNKDNPSPERPAPTISDYAYGNDSKRQRFDFWKAESNAPTPVVLLIHGGGWKNGDKTGFGNNPIRKFLREGISVAAINYRFIKQAMEQGIEPPVKAPLMDAARALQTIRAHAVEWNIDPEKIGATGSSAGACTSLWLALHDDLAIPTSDDPIERQSSRLACAAVVGAQTSLDPRQLREWIGNSIYGGHAFGFAAEGRSREQEFALLLENREKVLPWIREFSPIEWVSEDDPPIFLEYPKQKGIPVLGGNEPDPTHSAMYGIQLQRACQASNVSCELVFPENIDSQFENSHEFLIYHLKR